MFEISGKTILARSISFVVIALTIILFLWLWMGGYASVLEYLNDLFCIRV